MWKLCWWNEVDQNSACYSIVRVGPSTLILVYQFCLYSCVCEKMWRPLRAVWKNKCFRCHWIYNIAVVFRILKSKFCGFMSTELSKYSILFTNVIIIIKFSTARSVSIQNLIRILNGLLAKLLALSMYCWMGNSENYVSVAPPPPIMLLKLLLVDIVSRAVAARSLVTHVWHVRGRGGEIWLKLSKAAFWFYPNFVFFLQFNRMSVNLLLVRPQ